MKNLYFFQLKRTTISCMAIGLVASATLFVGCRKNDGPALAITSFTPPEGAEGGTVEINGIAFNTDKSKNTVKFHDVVAEVTDATAQKLTVTVPDGATTGKISVTVGDKTVTTTTDFTVVQSAPIISALSPDRGDVGTEVVITGKRFTPDTKVFFGGKAATDITVVSRTEVKVKVPADAVSGKVKVVCGSFEAISAVDFMLKPTITAISNWAIEEGEEITIQGTNFSRVAGENKVSFGAGISSEVTNVSTTELRAKVPESATTGKIKVEVRGQVAEYKDESKVLPALISFSPESSERGALVTLTGRHFDPAELRVYLNGREITSFEGTNTATSIAFKVPADGKSGKISVYQYGYQKDYLLSYTVTGSWQVLKDRNPLITNLAAGVAFSHDNLIYWGLGNDNGTMLANWQVFNPASNEWTKGYQITDLVKMNHAAIVNWWGEVYFGNGVRQNGTKDGAWYRYYQPDGGYFVGSEIKFPTNISNSWVTAYANEIYAGFGTGNGKIYQFRSGSTYRFWMELVDVPQTGGCLIDGTGFAYGGTIIMGAGYNTCESKANNKFFKTILSTRETTPIADLPVAVQYCNGFTIANKAFVLTQNGDLFEYDYNANKWKTLASAGFASRYAAVIDDKLYAISETGKIAVIIPSIK
ncbi:IPT/TIG domain-containing protein [Paraflavitalea sp. CAU 1676]|uniref:IPT/TIG domain-containing protein n=1 Tax=Paraflavitalea sp. CAU 1676 TaxID=3032598 RepID=UPI0023DC84CA|nr:IPT/TIG domain-containing protein [Paraflavitalea sp. CAU 1676]MDF2191491.1 IPT/TIG domain-containing protein [Paraflavitalea sp. CAU 1676]